MSVSNHTTGFASGWFRKFPSYSKRFRKKGRAGIFEAGLMAGVFVTPQIISK